MYSNWEANSFKSSTQKSLQMLEMGFSNLLSEAHCDYFHAFFCRATRDPGDAHKDALVGVDAQCPHRSHGVSS